MALLKKINKKEAPLSLQLHYIFVFFTFILYFSLDIWDIKKPFAQETLKPEDIFIIKKWCEFLRKGQMVISEKRYLIIYLVKFIFVSLLLCLSFPAVEIS